VIQPERLDVTVVAVEKLGECWRRHRCRFDAVGLVGCACGGTWERLRLVPHREVAETAVTAPAAIPRDQTVRQFLYDVAATVTGVEL
jgi:hypothetical protein